MGTFSAEKLRTQEARFVSSIGENVLREIALLAELPEEGLIDRGLPVVLSEVRIVDVAALNPLSGYDLRDCPERAFRSDEPSINQILVRHVAVAFVTLQHRRLDKRSFRQGLSRVPIPFPTSCG